MFRSLHLFMEHATNNNNIQFCAVIVFYCPPKTIKEICLKFHLNTIDINSANFYEYNLGNEREIKLENLECFYFAVR